jgi:23S rRNA (pseudouridine1915-N3)-methyltransferase
MKILIISPGKPHDSTVADAIAQYEVRMRAWSVEWSLPSASDVEKEGAAILKQLKDGDWVVLLDERGKSVDSPGFAMLVDARVQSGTKRLVFIIGGAFGVNEAVATRADMTLALSSLVFPHMLVRLILVEQLYRAQTILTGGKYHHA